jgi:hypothetical protein
LDEEKKKFEPPKAPVAGTPMVSPMVPFGDQQRGVIDDLLAKIRGGHVKQESINNRCKLLKDTIHFPWFQ